MQTYIMLTRLAHGGLQSPRQFEALERQVMERIETECPEVEWIDSYAVLGPYDYIDVFRAPRMDEAIKVATIVRTFGHAETETWAATDWGHFKELSRSISTPSL